MINIDELKKKIIYRSNYRGTKEMDNLLGAFTKKYIDELSIEDLYDLEKLLAIDDNNLYNFFNDTATTEIYTLSLHDALPIYLLFLTINFYL